MELVEHCAETWAEVKMLVVSSAWTMMTLSPEGVGGGLLLLTLLQTDNKSSGNDSGECFMTE